MVDKLDQRTTQKATDGPPGIDQVDQREHRQRYDEAEAVEHLEGGMMAPPARQLVVPQRRQDVLAKRVRHELQGGEAMAD